MKKMKFLAGSLCLLFVAACTQKSPLDKTIDDINSVTPISIGERTTVDSVLHADGKVTVYVSTTGLGSSQDWLRRGFEDHAKREMHASLASAATNPKGSTFYLSNLFGETYRANTALWVAVTDTATKKHVDLFFSGRELSTIIDGTYKAPSKYYGMTENEVLTRVIYEVRDEMKENSTPDQPMWLADCILAPDEFTMLNNFDESQMPTGKLFENIEGIRESLIQQFKDNDDSYIIAAACARTGRKFSMQYVAKPSNRDITITFTPDELIKLLEIPIDDLEEEEQ